MSSFNYSRKVQKPGVGSVIGAVLIGLLFFAGVVAILSVLLMFAWNLFAPVLFGLPVITDFKVAFGMLIFIAIVGNYFKGSEGK